MKFNLEKSRQIFFALAGNKVRTGVLFLAAAALFPSCNGLGSAADEPPLEGKVKREVLRLAPKLPGRIAEIKVTEAASVQRGDTLAILEVPEVAARLQQAQGGVSSARAQYQLTLNGATREQLQQAEAACRAAAEQMNFAGKSFERVRTMYRDSLVPEQQFDEVRMKFKGAKAQYEASSAKLAEVRAGVRNEQQQMAMGQLQMAEGKLAEAQIAENERYIIAPEALSIEVISLQEGELSLPGYNLFTAYKLKETFFRFTVPESQVALFRNGQRYQVELPFSGEIMEAELQGIKQMASYADRTSSYPQYQLGEAVYELKLVPADQKKASELPSNYTLLLKPAHTKRAS